MKELLSAYEGHGKDLQGIVTLYHWLKAHGKTIEDVEEYLETEAGKRTLRQTQGREPGKRDVVLTEEKCPECKARLILRPIKIPRGTGNLYGHKWHKYCSGRECLFEKYGKDR